MAEETTRQQLHNGTLGQDIREFGDLLGEIIRSQESETAYETVEMVRTGSIEYRAGDRDSRQPVRHAVSGADPETQRVIARAFLTYFELTNIAEERERVRVIRSSSQEGTLEESLGAAATQLTETDPDTAAQILDDLLIQPTFTAHPTEAHRKTVKAKLRTIATRLETLDERRLTRKEREQIERDIRAEVLGFWQTPQIREHAPDPEDEARNVQWYLANTIFEVLPEVYDELGDALEGLNGPQIPKLFEFRSWAGSDRDGNPHVTLAVTETTLERQRRIVIERYREALAEMSSVLSQDGNRMQIGPAISGSIEAVEDTIPEARDEANKRYPEEPYRQKLMVMREKLDRIGDIRPGGYAGPEEFHDELAAIAQSLRENGCSTIAEAHVEKLMRQVEAFGFTLASLDLRDHQKNHTTAVAEALAREGIEYAELSEDERVDRLTEAVLQENSVVDLQSHDGLSETAVRVFKRFERLASWQREYGQDAIDTYCISMTEEPSHVLEVLFLADQAGVVDLPGHSGLDIVPLLETERALSGADRIMGTLFENEAYGMALAARGTTQEIMLGYSDSNKENGYLAANWSLHKNQRRLADITADHDVTLRLFHGRGGSISRGGGPMNDALKALPNSTVTGDVKFTEQGEAIAEKYSNKRIAERELEQMLTAQIWARKQALDNPTEALDTEWIEAMDLLADAARTEYRDLLDTDGFLSYFEQATPIDAVEALNLGSRPASRSDERSVADLRAIPWVFSWTQSRCILPGWYSLATGIDAYLDDGGTIDTLQEMYAEWPFFRTMLDNAAQALGRSEMEIARSYAALADDDLQAQFFPRLEAEYERAVELVTTITGRDSPIDREWLQESLDRRNPYVDPLNLLQTALLEKDDLTPTEEQTLRLTVKGIAAGMNNTG